jgi:hypothetical protein
MPNTLRRRQPQAIPAIDGRYLPIVKSAIVGNNLYDVARRAVLPSSSLGNLGRQGAAKATALVNSGNSYQIVSNGNLMLPTGSEVTILWQAYKQAETGATGVLGNNLASTTEECTIYLPYSGDGRVYWRWGGESAGSSELSVGGLTFAPDDWWAFTAGPRGNEIWQNFALVGSNAAGSGVSRTSGFGNALSWGTHLGTSSYTTIVQSLFGVLAKQLPMSFLRSGNYWQLFAPQRRPQVFAPQTLSSYIPPSLLTRDPLNTLLRM